MSILQAYGLSAHPQPNLLQNVNQHELYFYPHQTLTEMLFLLDILNYWRVKQGALTNRRVAFLLSGEIPIAIVLEFSVSQNCSAARLWHAHAAKTDEKMLADPSFMKEVRRWHTQIRVMVLGIRSSDPQSEKIRRTLEAVLPKIGMGTQFRINFTCIDDKFSPEVILVQDVLTMLSRWATDDMKPEVCQRQHRDRCIQAGLTRCRQFDGIQILRQVVKFSQLIAQRGRYVELWPDELAHDHSVKRFIYEPTLNIHLLLEALPLTDLLALLAQPTQEAWLTFLNEKKQTQRSIIVRWEQQRRGQTLRENWCNYFTRKAKDSIMLAYQHSWIGLTQQIIQSLAKTVFTNKAPHATTPPPESGRGIGGSLRLLGAGLGLGLQWYLGPVELLRTLIVVNSAQTVYQALQSRELHEETAEVVPTVISSVTLLRLGQVIVSLIEAFLSDSCVPLILAVGSIGGSVVAMTLAQVVSPDLASCSNQRQEERHSALFLIALGGSQCGQWGAKLFYVLIAGMQQRLLHREVAMQLLAYLAQAQSDVQSLRVETPSFRYSPSLWWSERNPIHLEWTTRAGDSRSVDCTIQALPVLTPQGLVGLTCEQQTIHEFSSVLALPSP